MASDFMQNLGEVVERERERFKVPGISVGILRDGAVEAAGYGVGSLDTNDAVSWRRSSRSAPIRSLHHDAADDAGG